MQLKRLVTTGLGSALAVAALALPASALALPECPSTLQPSGNARGGLLGSEIIAEVHAYFAANEAVSGPPSGTLKTEHGNVHWEVVPGSQYAMTEEDPNHLNTAKRAYGRPPGNEGLLGATWFSGISSGWWYASVSAEVKVSGPGAAYEPYAADWNGCNAWASTGGGQRDVYYADFGLEAKVIHW